MSFILDALKKSESDRQRQSGPALFEVRVAPPRTRLPLWAIAIALLLLVNFGIVMWMLLRHPAHSNAPLSATAPATAPVSAAPVSAAPVSAAPVSAAPAPAASSGPPAGAVPPVPVAATSAPATAGPQAGAATAPPQPSAATPSGATAETTNPEDYAPAQEQPSAASGLASHVRRGTSSGVPLYQDLSSAAGTPLPQLRLDLHVFAAHPQERFVMINMHKLREGDTLPEGVHVDNITPEGVILSFNGSKFLLPRD